MEEGRGGGRRRRRKEEVEEGRGGGRKRRGKEEEEGRRGKKRRKEEEKEENEEEDEEDKEDKKDFIYSIFKKKYVIKIFPNPIQTIITQSSSFPTPIIPPILVIKVISSIMKLDL